MKNVVYIGTLAQGKRTTVGHKVKKEIQVPECDWIVIENAYEPIISKMNLSGMRATVLPISVLLSVVTSIRIKPFAK